MFIQDTYCYQFLQLWTFWKFGLNSQVVTLLSKFLQKNSFEIIYLCDIWNSIYFNDFQMISMEPKWFCQNIYDFFYLVWYTYLRLCEKLNEIITYTYILWVYFLYICTLLYIIDISLRIYIIMLKKLGLYYVWHQN